MNKGILVLSRTYSINYIHYVYSIYGRITKAKLNRPNSIVFVAILIVMIFHFYENNIGRCIIHNKKNMVVSLYYVVVSFFFIHYLGFSVFPLVIIVVKSLVSESMQYYKVNCCNMYFVLHKSLFVEILSSQASSRLIFFGNIHFSPLMVTTLISSIACWQKCSIS